MASENSSVAVPTSHIGQPQDIKMKKILALLLAACISLSASAEELVSTRLIGHYSNIQAEGNDDPHFVSGYTIALYERNNETLAHVMVAIGSPEPARATIKNLTHDPSNKFLTFTALYSAGLETNYIKAAPDREAFKELSFRGIVVPGLISGKMVKDFYCSRCRPVITNVTLTRIEEMGRTGEAQPFPQ
jgi:hypothetical protein